MFSRILKRASQILLAIPVFLFVISIERIGGHSIIPGFDSGFESTRKMLAGDSIFELRHGPGNIKCIITIILSVPEGHKLSIEIMPPHRERLDLSMGSTGNSNEYYVQLYSKKRGARQFEWITGELIRLGYSPYESTIESWLIEADKGKDDPLLAQTRLIIRIVSITFLILGLLGLSVERYRAITENTRTEQGGNRSHFTTRDCVFGHIENIPTAKHRRILKAIYGGALPRHVFDDKTVDPENYQLCLKARNRFLEELRWHVELLGQILERFESS